MTTQTHDEVISEYIEKYSRYDYADTKRIVSPGQSKYIIDSILFIYDEGKSMGSYINIDGKEFHVDWTRSHKLINIIHDIYINSNNLKKKFLLETNLINLDDILNIEKNKLVIEKFEEFEVIKNGKLDQISYDSLVEYYAR